MEEGGPSDTPASSGTSDSNVSAAVDTATPDGIALTHDAPKTGIQMDNIPWRGEGGDGAPLAIDGVGNTECLPSLCSDEPQSLTSGPAVACKTAADFQKPQMPVIPTEEAPLTQDTIRAPVYKATGVTAVEAAFVEKESTVQKPRLTERPGQLAEDETEAPLETKSWSPSCPLLHSNGVYMRPMSERLAVNSHNMAFGRESKNRAETVIAGLDAGLPFFIGEPGGSHPECEPISGSLPTITNGSPGRAKPVRPPPGFESLREGAAPTQPAVRSPQSVEDSDESDHEIRVEDLYNPDMPREAAKRRSQQKQRREPPPPKMFEHLYWMMQRFTAQFARVHVERECDNTGVSVCVICRDAQTLLVEIQEAVRNEPRSREFILSKAHFMSVLVELCRVSSSRSPSICGVTGPDIQKFVEGRGYCNGGSVMTVMEGLLSDLLWERFLGEASKKVKRVTYTIRPRPPAAPSDGDASVPTPSDESVSKSLDAARCNRSSLDVAGCLDARHLWIFHDAGAQPEVHERWMAEARRAFARDSLRVVPSVGEIAGLPTPYEDCPERVLVVEDCGEVAVVWHMDRGNFRKVRWSELVPLGASFKALPPAVCLAVLAGVKPMPYVGLLRECVKLFQALTNHFMGEMPFHLFLVTKMTSHGAIPALVELLFFPDYETRMASIRCLSQLCRRLTGRHAVSKAGCVMKVLDRLRKAVSEHPESGAVVLEREKQHLISLLQAVFFRNWEHIHELADTDMVAVIYKVLETSPEGSVTHRLVQFCLRCVLDSGYKERRLQVRPRSYASEPANPEDQNCPVDATTGFQKPSGFADTSQEVTTTPTMVPSSTAQVSESSEPATASPAATAPAPPSQPPAPPGGRCYIRNSVLPLRCDETCELLAITNMKMASARVLATLACSFLNSWRPCAILYGISTDGQVRGVELTRDECTSLRRGIYFMVGNLRPRPPEGSFTVEFVPVLWNASQLPQAVATHYVVEVKLCGVPRTVYTTSDGDCFLRRGGETCQANTFEVRSWLVQQEEEHYLRLAAESTPETSGDGGDLLSSGSAEGSAD